MKNGICFLIFAMLAFTSVYANEPQNESVPTEESKCYRVYFGPDVFFQHFHWNSSSRYQITSTSIAGGLKFGYDFVKPHHFYHGGEGLISGVADFVTRRGYDWGYYKTRFTDSRLFANLEERFGYTFTDHFSSKFTLAPFMGLGSYFSGIAHDWSLWIYAAIGLRANQKFTDTLDVGFNVKVMSAIAGVSHDRDYFGKTTKAHFNNFWGYEVALPITYRPKAFKNWDIQVQPYVLQLHSSSLSPKYGLRVLAGYNF